MRYRHVFSVLTILGGATFAIAQAAADTLPQLIAGAKKESSLRVTLHPTITPDTAKKVAAAFNRAYGLSIDVKPDLTGRYSGKAAKGAIEYKSGGKPSYDVMVLNESAFMTLANADALVKIDGWEKMLPKGTHEYGKFIRPSELGQWIREAGLELKDITGMTYNPLTKTYKLNPRDVSVNYLVHVKKPL